MATVLEILKRIEVAESAADIFYNDRTINWYTIKVSMGWKENEVIHITRTRNQRGNPSEEAPPLSEVYKTFQDTVGHALILEIYRGDLSTPDSILHIEAPESNEEYKSNDFSITNLRYNDSSA